MWPFRRRSWFDPKGWERDESRRKKRIACVAAHRDVQNLLRAMNRDVSDIEEFYNRIMNWGLGDRQAKKAISNTEILRWYFSVLSADKQLDLGDYLKLAYECKRL